MKPNFPHRLRFLLARVSACRKKTALFVLTGIAGIPIIWSLAPDNSLPACSPGAIISSPSRATITRRSFVPEGRWNGGAGTTKKSASPAKKQDEEAADKWRIAFTAGSAITDPIKREEALARLCFERAESDPREALELAIEHGIEGSPGVIANLAQQWAAVDLPSARAWAESQPEGRMREDLLARIGYVWSLSDPAAAANFVSNSITPGEAQIEAAISILHQWSGQDPTAARAWVECFPEGPLRERALHEADGPRGNIPSE